MRKAFSLIELLIVIAIVAILAAIAVPVYQAHTLRVKIATALNGLNPILKDALVIYHRKGSFPASVTYKGTNLTTTPPNWFNVADSNMSQLFYFVSADGKGAFIAARLKNLSGIPGYVENGNYAAIILAFRDINGVLTTGCGRYDSANAIFYVPFTYLPGSCQCANVLSFTNSGTPC